MKDLELDAMFINICLMYKKCIMQRQRKRRLVKHRINQDRRNHHHKVLSKMNTEDFFNNTRMTRSVFDLLLKLLAKELCKERQSIDSEERLALTLLYLAHGTSIDNLAMSYILDKTTVRNIVLETCEMLWRFLSPMYVNEPTEAQYKDIAEDFYNKWNVPNCVGALGAKHIDIKGCRLEVSDKNNEINKNISVIAACDAKYTFTVVSIVSDLDNFHISRFGEALMTNRLPLPSSTPLSVQSVEPFPFFFAGDSEFPLRDNLMRPYPEKNLDLARKIFNYRLTRANSVIENSFGVLTARWRILDNGIEWNSENCETIILACIALHNFIMLNDQQHMYCPLDYVDWMGADNTLNYGNWRTDVNSFGPPVKSIISFVHRGPASAILLRDNLAKYFTNEGAISYQNCTELINYEPYENDNYDFVYDVPQEL